MTQYGYFFLADISGFTAYLVGVELQHAKDILGELLEYIAEQTRPILIFEKFEGDSVFAYAPEEKIARGESVLELIESTYVGFKDRLASMSRRITCTCAACRNVTNLDLKFMVHYGEYLSQQVREHHELLGPAPIYVQKREWKEAVAKSTGWRGYALFSEISLKRLDVHLDEIEGVEFPFAEVKMHGLDLEARYQATMEARRVVVLPEEADREFKLTLPHPPVVVWEWLNDPQKRNLWYPSLLKWSAYLRPGGRTAAGAVNHCNHGVGRVVEKILDWRPFDYFTVEMRMVPGNIVFLMTIRLEPILEGKTRIHGCLRMQNPRLLAGLMAEITARFLGSRMRKIDHFVRQKT